MTGVFKKKSHYSFKRTVAFFNEKSLQSEKEHDIISDIKNLKDTFQSADRTSFPQ